jgi:hypothetical protein
VRHVPGWSYPLVFALAYCAGSAIDVRFDAWPTIRSDWAALPVRNWQWIFYLALLAAIAAAVTADSPLRTWAGRALILATAIVGAWWLTGVRSLPLPRAACIALVASYFLVLALPLNALARRIPPTSWLALLAMSAAALAALVSYYASQTYGQMAATAAAALAGAALFAWVVNETTPPRGIAFPFAVVVGGWAAVAVISYNNLAALLLVPAAPLAAWASVVGPLKKSGGATALAVQAAAVIFVIAIAALLLRISVGE